MTERESPRPAIPVVDDEQPNVDLFVRLLSSQGYSVDSVGDGEAALSTLEGKHFDLVLLDVQLPGMSGFEVCRWIKQRPATRLTPVVLVTGLQARQARDQGHRSGR